MRFVHNKGLVFPAAFSVAIGVASSGKIFLRRPELGVVVGGIVILMIFVGFALLLLQGIMVITVREDGISSWQLFRWTKFTWDDVREVGIGMVYVGRGARPFRGWHELDYRADVYISTRLLTDYERVCGAKKKFFRKCDLINFSYANLFFHTGALPKTKKALCENYPGVVPPNLQWLAVKPRPSYAVRIPEEDGSFFEEWHYVEDYRRIYYGMESPDEEK